MKKFILLLAVMFQTIMAFGQAKKPTIMVVPSDNWCYQNGYTNVVDNQGKQIKVSDYKKALQENSDLLLAISKINELMQQRGFPLKNLETCIKSLENAESEEHMMTSKNGAEVSETPVDKLKKVAKADIIMQLTWNFNQVGPKKSLTFNLQGLDSYTDKQIAGASGTSSPAMVVEVPVMLEEAVLAHIDNFNAQLQQHFDDMAANGREVSLKVRAWDDFEDGLEKDIDGKELSEVIEEWVSANTVNGRFNTTDATESMLNLEQVRIPLYDANGKAIDTRGWAKGLQKELRNKYQIEAKLSIKGLGEADLYIGSK